MIDKEINYSNQNNMPNDEEISLGQIFHLFWVNKLIIISFFMLSSFFSVLYALSLPDMYKSYVTLAPAEQSSKISPQIAGLASLAGVSTSRSNQIDKTMLGFEVMTSFQFFKEFDSKYNILPALMATSDWDKSKNNLIYKDAIYNPKLAAWSNNSIPSLQDAHKQFNDHHFNLSQDSDTRFITMSISHFSPYIAKEWLELMVIEVNEIIRNKDLLQAKRSIKYLNEEIKTVEYTELRAGLYGLIQNEMQKIMLANASPEYLFQTIDPAYVPENKFSPIRSLICIVGSIFGFIFGCFFVLIRNFIRINN